MGRFGRRRIDRRLTLLNSRSEGTTRQWPERKRTAGYAGGAFQATNENRDDHSNHLRSEEHYRPAQHLTRYAFTIPHPTAADRTRSGRALAPRKRSVPGSTGSKCRYGRLPSEAVAQRETPDSEAPDTSSPLHHLVLNRCLRQRGRPAFSEQVGAQIVALGETGATSPANRRHTAVRVSGSFVAVDETSDLEVQRQRGPRRALDGPLERTARLTRRGHIDTEEVDGSVPYA